MTEPTLIHKALTRYHEQYIACDFRYSLYPEVTHALTVCKKSPIFTSLTFSVETQKTLDKILTGVYNFDGEPWRDWQSVLEDCQKAIDESLRISEKQLTHDINEWTQLAYETYINRSHHHQLRAACDQLRDAAEYASRMSD